MRGKLLYGIGIWVMLPFLQMKVAESKPLNYLIILGDDISSSSLGCYGSVNLNTSPNIDKLAEEGIRFTNMFVSEAVCAPTRAELYTGLQPHRNGCKSNHMNTKTGTLSIVQHLEKLGYRVGLTGKRHFSPTSVYPFEKVAGFEENCNSRAPIAESWEGVEEFITRDPNQPFCLIICSIHAHAPWDAGNTSLWNQDEIQLPPHMVDTDTTRHYFREHLAEVRLFDEQVGKARAMMQKLALNKNTALIVLDENGTGMPGGKWSNYDWGVRSACIMKWPKPYSRAFQTNALAQYCDIVPTLIEAAGGDLPDGLDGKSLLPLISGKTTKHRDHAFFVYNNGKEGTDFASRAVTDGRFKLMWNLTPDNLFAIRVINGFDFGYVDKMEDRHVRKIYESWLEKAKTDTNAKNMVLRFRKQPEFQLYDLKTDPWEMNNLAENPEYAVRLTELKQALKRWMHQQGDMEFTGKSSN
ncbi:sulfatase [Mangrovibacterium sp.]|uniref:sulfatase family protein n=1 Tax=Mangrovibacterium sp. TaxID=1961364 RepID=UPI003565A747